jgi:hypothetical protein
MGRGAKRTVAALAVMARDAAQRRFIDTTVTKTMNKTMNQKKNLRTNTPKPNPARVPKTLRGNDVTRAAPVAIATRRTGVKPTVTTTPGGITVAHRSFLFPVNNTLNFTATRIACNPGLSGSFPWLAKLARRYEQYRFKKLRYEFRSVTASSTSGVVMMSFDFDAADEAPATKAEQAQTIPNSETNVWMNNDLNVRPDTEWHFVRAGTLAQNLDVKTYDMGNLWLSAAYGDNVTGGELYVEYVVELRRPTDGPEVCGRYYAGTTNFAAPIGTGNVEQTGAAFPFERAGSTGFNVISGGAYMIAVRNSGTGLTAAVPLPTIVSGGTSSAAATIFSVVEATQCVAVYKVRVDTGDTIVFANAGAGTSLTAVRFAVASIDYTPL